MSTRWPDKTVIGLTGNIATGKSVVRRMLEALDAFGIDADGLAHRAMSPGAPAYQPIIDTFGRWILAEDGQIDRSKLGKLVFNDPDAMSRLEAITHPIVKQVVDLLIRRSKQKVVVIEAIKLIESGIAQDCDALWVVNAPEDVQVRRLMQARNMTEAEARQRIAAQPPQADKLDRADVILRNAGGYEETFEQVQMHLNTLLGVPAPAEEAAVEEAPPAAPEAAPAPAPAVAPAEVAVTRGGPKHAELIAGFINQATGSSLSRGDVMVRFGQKAYMIAEKGSEVLGVGGWQVENLITRIDELLFAPGAPITEIAAKLLDSIEHASNLLQSEISLLFLGKDAPDALRQAAQTSGYSPMEVSDLVVPDWREAAEESAPPETILNVKRLREDRVLKPI